MAKVELKGISKVFEGNVRAVDNEIGRAHV